MDYMIWVWLGAAVVFGIVEALTAGLVSIWFVAGSAAGLVALAVVVLVRRRARQGGVPRRGKHARTSGNAAENTLR